MSQSINIPPEQYYLYFPSGQSIHLWGDIQSQNIPVDPRYGHYRGEIEICVDLQYYSIGELCTLFSTKLGLLNLILHNQNFQQVAGLLVEDVELIDILEFNTNYSQRQRINLHCRDVQLYHPTSVPADFLSYQRDFKLGLLGI